MVAVGFIERLWFRGNTQLAGFELDGNPIDVLYTHTVVINLPPPSSVLMLR